MDAKERENLWKSLHKVNRDDDFHFKTNPEYTDYLIKDAIRSMMERVRKFGTSQDPSEWTDPPEYTLPTEHKGFVMMIVKYSGKFKGLAKSMDGKYNLESSWSDTINGAGQQIVKYINLFRKQVNEKKLDDLIEKRRRAKELQEFAKSIALN